MHHNGQQVVLASTLPPNRIDLTPGVRPSLACPTCGAWRLLRRGMITPHNTHGTMRRCAGSGQRVTLDLTPAAWRARLAIGDRHAGMRHGTPVRLRPTPPVARPVCRLAS